MKILLLTLSILMSFSASGATLSVVKSEDLSFQVSIPKEWENVEKKKLKDPMVISAISKEKTASLIVLATTDNKMTCKEFLLNTDASRNAKNNLPTEKQTLTAEFLKTAEATEGAVGEYEIQGKGSGFPVVQKSLCFKSKEQIRMLTGAWQKKMSAQFEPLFKDIFASFKFLPAPKPNVKK